MSTCVVSHCKSQYRDGYVLRMLPRDELMAQQWRDAIDLHSKVDWNRRKVNKVCEVHFKRDDWIKYRGNLKKDAVPSLFPVQPVPLPKPKRIPFTSVDFVHEDHTYTKPARLCPVKKPLREVQLNNSSFESTPVPKLPLPRLPVQRVFNQPMLYSLIRAPVISASTEARHVTTSPCVDHAYSKQGKESVLAEARSESAQLYSSLMDTNASLTSTLKETNANLSSSLTSTNLTLSSTLAEMQKKIEENDRLVLSAWEEKKRCEELFEKTVGRSIDEVRYSDGQKRWWKWDTKSLQKGMKVKYGSGSTGYRVVKSELNASLPSTRSLQRITENIKFEPGIQHLILEAFKKRLDQFACESDKDCVLVFDEMSLKSQRDYDPSTKNYIGGVTLPGVSGLATKGLVFMFGGVRQKWKLTSAYHLTPSTGCGEEIAQVIKDLLAKACSMGMNVLGIVCDMGNRDILKTLGYDFTKHSMKYSITNPADPTKKLLCIPDVVHIFKSVKEMFVNNKEFTLPPEIVHEFNLPSNKVCVSHIEWLEDIQRDMDLKFVPKLRLKTIQSSHFSKMNMNGAFTVLSRPVGSSLTYLADIGLAPNQVRTTSWFVSLMNRWFSLLSSRSLRNALSLHNMAAYEEAIRVLNLVIKVFKGINVNDVWKPVQTHVIMATEALLDVQHHLLHDKKYKFVCMARFTQDKVENLFSTIRLQRPTATPKEFKYRLKQITVSKFNENIKSTSYSHDDSDYIVGLEDLLNMQDQFLREDCNEDIAVPEWTNVPQDSLSFGFEKCEDDILYRVCGYIVHSLSKKRNMLKCNTCIESLRHKGPSPHRNSHFLQLTNYVPGAQFEVSDVVFQLFRTIDFNLQNWRPSFKDKRFSVPRLLENQIYPNISNFQLGTCHDIKCIPLVKSFVMMRLKQFSESLTSMDGKPSEGHHLASRSLGYRYFADRYYGSGTKQLSTAQQSTPISKCNTAAKNFKVRRLMT